MNYKIVWAVSPDEMEFMLSRLHVAGWIVAKETLLIARVLWSYHFHSLIRQELFTISCSRFQGASVGLRYPCNVDLYKTNLPKWWYWTIVQLAKRINKPFINPGFRGSR